MEKDFESKRLFVLHLRSALIGCGDGRYDGVAGMKYVSDGTTEQIMQGDRIIADVTGDSLAGLLVDIGKVLS